jgi:hypothetical protein
MVSAAKLSFPAPSSAFHTRAEYTHLLRAESVTNEHRGCDNRLIGVREAICAITKSWDSLHTKVEGGYGRGNAKNSSVRITAVQRMHPAKSTA